MSFSDEYDWVSLLLEFELKDQESYLATDQGPHNGLEPRSPSPFVFSQTFDDPFVVPSPQVAGSTFARDEEANTPAAPVDDGSSGPHIGGLSEASSVFGQIKTPGIRTEKKRVATDNVIGASVKRRKTMGKFTCKLCNQTFTAQHNLKNHMNSHCQIKLYRCGRCGKAFVTRSDCKRHEKRPTHP